MTAAAVAVDTTHYCHVCMASVDVTKAERKQLRGSPIYFHPECWAKFEAERQARQEADDRILRQRAERENAIRLDGITKAIPALVRGVPEWKWCRVGTPEFARAIKSPKLAAFAQNWAPDRGSALLSGKSGQGKTAATVALVWRLIDAMDRADPKLRGAHSVDAWGNADWRLYGKEPICGLKWVQACDIANARLRSELGKEPEIIARAKGAQVLVIDEMGFESREPDPAFLEILDHRYRLQMPTIVTSGMARAEFLTRYGSMIFRRLTEPGLGSLIEC